MSAKIQFSLSTLKDIVAVVGLVIDELESHLKEQGTSTEPPTKPPDEPPVEPTSSSGNAS